MRATVAYIIEDYCDALACFMHALGIPAAHVYGTSCGGTIAACFANRLAGRTLSAVIVETPLRTYDGWGARWDHTEGTVTVFENSGHFPMLDEPERFSQALADFARAAGG